jgi:hypothetical protein
MVASGAALPFLGPLFAAQFLIASRRPLGLVQALGMSVVIVVTGQVLVIACDVFASRPLVLLCLLWLVYFACFFKQERGASAASLILLIAIIVPLLEILQRDLGETTVAILVKAVLSGALLAWLAHVVFPHLGPDVGKPPAPSTSPSATTFASRRAIASAFILVAAVILCLVDDRLATAIVIPVTVSSLLSQLDLVTSGRTVVGLVIINLLGGIAASLAFVLLEVRPSVVFLFVIVLLAGLLFGGRAAAHPELGKVYVGALTIFLILFGLGVSPLPVDTPESFSTRVAYVLFAILYTVCLAALLWPRAEPAAPIRISRPHDADVTRRHVLANAASARSLTAVQRKGED